MTDIFNKLKLAYHITCGHECYFRIYRKTVLPVNKLAIQARGSKRQIIA